MPTKLSLRCCDFIASGFYSGYAPKAPGTFGTLVAALLVWLLSTSNPTFLHDKMFLFALATFIAGVIVSEVLLRADFYATGNKDPQRIVIDEFAGYFVTLIGFGLTPVNLFAAFLAFRLFDILKPPPIRRLENFPGGLGIMLDDLLAGVYANLLLRAVFYFVTIA